MKPTRKRGSDASSKGRGRGGGGRSTKAGASRSTKPGVSRPGPSRRGANTPGANNPCLISAWRMFHGIASAIDFITELAGDSSVQKAAVVSVLQYAVKKGLILRRGRALYQLIYEDEHCEPNNLPQDSFHFDSDSAAPGGSSGGRGSARGSGRGGGCGVPMRILRSGASQSTGVRRSPRAGVKAKVRAGSGSVTPRQVRAARRSSRV